MGCGDSKPAVEAPAAQHHSQKQQTTAAKEVNQTGREDVTLPSPKKQEQTSVAESAVVPAAPQEKPAPEKPQHVVAAPAKPVERQEPEKINQTLDDIHTFSHQQPSAHDDEDPDLLEVDRLLLGTKSQIEKRPLDIQADVDAGTPAPPSSYGQQASLKRNEERSTANTNGRQLEELNSPSAKPEARQPAAEADPWASLQSAYRIQDTGPDTPTAGGRDSAFRGSAANRNKSTAPARSSAGGDGGQKKAEMVVLDEEEGYIEQQPLYAGQTRVQARLAAKPAAAPKQGGWGQGKMAQAGTLMLGDDDLHTLAPPQAVPSGGPEDDDGEDDEELLKLSQRVKAHNDLGVEDIEDVDDLIEQEAKAAGLGGDLAAKLAKFEALNEDE